MIGCAGPSATEDPEPLRRLELGNALARRQHRVRLEYTGCDLDFSPGAFCAYASPVKVTIVLDTANSRPIFVEFNLAGLSVEPCSIQLCPALPS